MTRIIFHVNLDAFFAAVEEIEDPALVGKPLVVGGSPDKRGVVASANYAAREFGVEAAMTTAQALRRCPQAIVRPLRRELYQEYAGRVLVILQRFSPIIEQPSMDEAFVDMTDQISDDYTPLGTARRLQAQIESELGLSVSIGVAANKPVAGIAGNFRKPHGLTEVPPGTEANFLASMPVQSLWGIGEKTAEQLEQMGIKTVGKLAQMPEAELVKHFGVNGARLWREANGIDHQAVKTERALKSLSQETTFEQDVSDASAIEETLLALSRKLAQRLRRHNLTARTVTLKIRYGDFSTLTRNDTQDPATHSTQDIYRRALHLLRHHWNVSRPLRLVGITVSHLVEGAEQLSLF